MKDLLLDRRMIRRYTQQPVAPELIMAVLEAGIHAPSPHNRQPWRFAVATGRARHRLATAMGEQLRLDLSRDGLPSKDIERDASRSYQRITGAHTCIVACLTMREMDAYPDRARALAERWMAVQAVAAACQNMLLRAGDLGLGACWMCAPLFCADVVSTALALAGDWEPQALITLGYPADSGRERERFPIDQVTLWVNA